jgi:hypothetical protein
MRLLPAEVSARWRSRVGSILDRFGSVCLRVGDACLDLREAINPQPSDLTPARADAILENVMARIEPPVPTFRPSATDIAGATLAAGIVATVWTQRDREGRLHVAVQRQDGRG